MLLVSSQRVHLQVEEVYGIFSRHRLRLQRLLTVLSLPFLSNGLNNRFVELTDVSVSSFGVQRQFEFPLCHGSLYPLAVAGVTGGSVAGSPVLQEAAVEGGALATVRSSLLQSSFSSRMTIQSRITGQ